MAPFRRELAVDVGLLIVGVPIALSAAETIAGSGWPVLAAASVPAVPPLAPLVAAVVSAGFGVELVAVGEGEVGGVLAADDDDDPVDVGLGELLVVDEFGAT